MTTSATLSSGRPRPVPTAETAAFWQAAAQDHLCLQQCDSCGWLLPVLAPRCPDCLGDSLSLTECSGRARLKGRTVLHVPGYPDQNVPVVLVECALDEEPRIVLVALDLQGVTTALAPDDPVSLRFHTDAEGSIAIVTEPSQ